MKRLSDQSLYEILEVPVGSTPEEIEKAYERVKVLYAPGSIVTYTLMDSDEAQYLARRIEEAHNVLLDPMARASYDAGLAAEQPRHAEPILLPPRPVPEPPPEMELPLEPEPRPEVITLRPRAEPVTGEPEEPEPAPLVAQPQERSLVESPAVAPPGTLQRALPLPPKIIPPLRTTPVAQSQVGPAGSDAAAPPETIPQAGIAGKTTPSQAWPAPVARNPDAFPTRAAPSAQAPEPKEFRVPEGTPWNGETLRRVREGRGLTLQQVSERTKVARHHLESIEADRYSLLPAPVYLRGFLMSFSKELRLDGQKVARSYLELVNAADAENAFPRPK